jgi:hypothetical protein
MSVNWEVIQAIGTCFGAIATFSAVVLSLYLAFYKDKEKFKGNIEIQFYEKDVPITLYDEEISSNRPINSIAKIFFNIENIRNTHSVILFRTFSLSKTNENFLIYLPNTKIINRQTFSSELDFSNPQIFDLLESQFGYLHTEIGTDIKLPIKIKFNDFKALIKNKLKKLEEEIKEYEIYKPLNKDDKVTLEKLNYCVYTCNFLYTIIKRKTIIDGSKYKRIYIDFKLPIDDKKILEVYNKIKEFKEYIKGKII